MNFQVVTGLGHFSSEVWSTLKSVTYLHTSYCLPLPPSTSRDCHFTLQSSSITIPVQLSFLLTTSNKPLTAFLLKSWHLDHMYGRCTIHWSINHGQSTLDVNRVRCSLNFALPILILGTPSCCWSNPQDDGSHQLHVNFCLGRGHILLPDDVPVNYLYLPQILGHLVGAFGKSYLHCRAIYPKETRALSPFLLISPHLLQ